MKGILLKDIYTKLYEILKTVSDKYNLDFEELHELYLKDLYIDYLAYAEN